VGFTLTSGTRSLSASIWVKMLRYRFLFCVLPVVLTLFRRTPEVRDTARTTSPQSALSAIASAKTREPFRSLSPRYRFPAFATIANWPGLYLPIFTTLPSLLHPPPPTLAILFRDYSAKSAFATFRNRHVLVDFSVPSHHIPSSITSLPCLPPTS
jgi:hypothetical protein